MSINWVMLAPTSSPPYTPLPGEQTLFTAPPRIGFAITTPAHYPGKKQTPFSLAHSTGQLYLTSRRLIYLPDKGTDKLQSFAAPILNIHDSHVTAPFFGPNVWSALLQPVQGGGIPVPSTGVVELKLTFKEGGAFDFHTTFERVKERLHQAVEASAASSGNGGGNGGSRAAAVNNVDANLEDLPAYQEESDGPLLSPVAVLPVPVPVLSSRSNGVVDGGREGQSHAANGFDPPPEPPPGYEEVQGHSNQDGMRP